MSKRERHNPLEESIPSKVKAANDSTENAVKGMVRQMPDEQSASVERIERLRPSQMMPDRFQPRRLLPAVLRGPFFSGEIDCYQAARAWLDLALKDLGWREQVGELLAMGGSFEKHGQIKPITGIWKSSEDSGFIFQIETGERRFWAACLRAAKERAKEEPLLRVEVVDKPTRERQVVENRHAQSPSAVGQACEVAALVLERMGIPPEAEAQDEFEYFRQAASLRVPRGTWPAIEPVMQLSTRRMQQLLAILGLPNELLEVADRHRLPERVLRELLALPNNAWPEAVALAVEQQLTSEQVAQLTLSEKGRRARSAEDDGRRAPERIAFTGLRRFLRAVMNVEPQDQGLVLDDVANEVVVQGMSQDLMDLMEALAERVHARQSRKD